MGRLARGACAVGVLLVLACAGPSPPPPEARAPRPAVPPGASPAPPEPVVHVLARGETIYRLSRHYGVSVDEIVRANDIRDVSSLPIGARLVIPGARHGSRASVAPSLYGKGAERARRESSLEFSWPLRGRFSSGFGRRGRRTHQGIDITARPGTPVRAAEAGRVIHSGWLGDYGRVVIVKHAGRYSTVYAHNSSNRVRKGQFVEKGQILAEVGSSGNASGPHLHFEVRRDRNPKDPLDYLPRSVPASVGSAR